MAALSTLGEELDRAFQDNYGKVFHGGPGLLEMKIVRGEEHANLTRRVIVEEGDSERRLYFTDPISRQKAELAMALRPFPPIR